jgi:two-component SAPR family response regulator
MGTYNGIDFASKINQIAPSCIIIFISNYLNYATEVYDVAHVYFILKSELNERLPRALEKAFRMRMDFAMLKGKLSREESINEICHRHCRFVLLVFHPRLGGIVYGDWSLLHP